MRSMVDLYVVNAAAEQVLKISEIPVGGSFGGSCFYRASLMTPNVSAIKGALRQEASGVWMAAVLRPVLLYDLVSKLTDFQTRTSTDRTCSGGFLPTAISWQPLKREYFRTDSCASRNAVRDNCRKNRYYTSLRSRVYRFGADSDMA